jgi:TrmH family RNA methyltransferase
LRLPLLVAADAPSILARLRKEKVRIFAASLDDAKSPAAADFSAPCALLIGNEGAGLPVELARAADERVRIPLADGVDSLNAAVAGAVLLYEAARQRNAKLRAIARTGAR